MFEPNYQLIISKFLSRQSNVEEFITEFMLQWKADMDVVAPDEKFGRMIDRIFTSCDCYYPDPDPKSLVEISEEQLRGEVSLFYYIWWGQEPGLQFTGLNK